MVKDDVVKLDIFSFPPSWAGFWYTSKILFSDMLFLCWNCSASLWSSIIYLRIYQLLWELCLYVDHLCGILWDFYDWGTSLSPPSLSLQVDRCFATLSLALKWIFTGDLVHFHFEQCPICTDTLSSRWKNFTTTKAEHLVLILVSSGCVMAWMMA